MYPTRVNDGCPVMKRAIYLVGGFFCFGFALVCGFFLLEYVAQGAGLQLLGPLWIRITPVSLLVGLIHVAGLALLEGVALVAGIALCSRGWISHGKTRPPDAGRS